MINLNISEEKYTKSLTYISYGNVIPIRGVFLNRINNFIVSKRLKSWLKRKKKLSNYIIWSFDPARLYTPDLIGATLSIFHCVDYYLFTLYGEREICEKSDYIFATSQRYLDEYEEFKTPKFKVPHGISSDEFLIDENEERKIITEITNLNISPNNYGLFIGKIDFRLDFDFLEKVVTKFSQEQFVFIGPIELLESPSAKRIFLAKKYKNVVHIGVRHFKLLKYYIHLSKFCFSYMDMEQLWNTVHHHKTLVYLAQGKPVFSPIFSEYNNVKELMYMSNDNRESIQLLANFIENSESERLKEKRIAYADSHSFKSILLRVENILNK
ncbi:MAG: hypothetical protein J5I47_06450 [Vicingus serpentipes]|nr:hypothetical protein [Vicingus serpentipes]